MARSTYVYMIRRKRWEGCDFEHPFTGACTVKREAIKLAHDEPVPDKDMEIVRFKDGQRDKGTVIEWESPEDE